MGNFYGMPSREEALQVAVNKLTQDNVRLRQERQKLAEAAVDWRNSHGKVVKELEEAEKRVEQLRAQCRSWKEKFRQAEAVMRQQSELIGKKAPGKEAYQGLANDLMMTLAMFLKASGFKPENLGEFEAGGKLHQSIRFSELDMVLLVEKE